MLVFGAVVKFAAVFSSDTSVKEGHECSFALDSTWTNAQGWQCLSIRKHKQYVYMHIKFLNELEYYQYSNLQMNYVKTSCDDCYVDSDWSLIPENLKKYCCFLFVILKYSNWPMAKSPSTHFMAVVTAGNLSQETVDDFCRREDHISSRMHQKSLNYTMNRFIIVLLSI